MNTGNDFSSLRYKAPADLRNQLTNIANAEKKKRVVVSLHFGNWFGASLGAIVAVCAILWLAIIRPSPDEHGFLRHEIVSAHVRSLMGEHIFDVASSDTHTVKPWFNGKLDFSPQVKDFAKRGFPLVGGRLDYIGSRPVASLVYKRDQHFINLFIWPTKESQSAATFSDSQGFHLWSWNQGGMSYHAISDLNASSLRDFMELLTTELK